MVASLNVDLIVADGDENVVQLSAVSLLYFITLHIFILFIHRRST